MKKLLLVSALLLSTVAAYAQAPTPKPLPPEHLQSVPPPPPPPPQEPPGAANQPPFVRDAQQKVRDGKLDEALAVYDAELKSDPDSFVANLQSGVVLDLMAKYDDARRRFAKAIEVAETPQEKAQANRSMAMSYAFARDCHGAAQYETPLYDQYVQAKDAYNAGEIANELARICLESGDFDSAQKWYETGHQAGLKEANISQARKDLWAFRWENALARLAARRGQKAEAQTHVQAAKAVFDRGRIPEQAQFVPYLIGYVAFYDGDDKTAVAELQKGNQRDPFILALLGQAYEKLGDQAQATECYRKVLAIPIHNPTGAYARPIAAKKLGTK